MAESSDLREAIVLKAIVVLIVAYRIHVNSRRLPIVNNEWVCAVRHYLLDLPGARRGYRRHGFNS